MRAHLSLDVRNVRESIAFYEKIFGQKPQKQTATYAKFDLKEPSLNFAMQEARDRWEVFFVHAQLATEGAQPPEAGRSSCAPGVGCC